MFTINRIETFSQEIKKSKFVAIAAPVATEAEAKEFLAQHSDPGANHNCWAWRIGQNYRFNDDGEPSGTAGKPILQAIDGQELDNIVVLVTRWFGGVLLGSGGLIRAYGGTAAMCLRQAEKSEYIERQSLSFKCSFSELNIIKSRLDVIEHAQLVSEEFLSDGVLLVYGIPSINAQLAAQTIADLTRGRAEVKISD